MHSDCSRLSLFSYPTHTHAHTTQFLPHSCLLALCSGTLSSIFHLMSETIEIFIRVWWLISDNTTKNNDFPSLRINQ